MFILSKSHSKLKVESHHQRDGEGGGIPATCVQIKSTVRKNISEESNYSSKSGNF